MKEKLIEYVKNHIDEDYDADEDELIDYLDSVSFLQMTVAIEQLCGIGLNLADIDIDDFTTMDTLVTMLEARRAALMGG